jgi:hypothetical protein
LDVETVAVSKKVKRRSIRERIEKGRETVEVF